MKVDLRCRSLDLGLPPHATDGYGSAIIGVPSRRAFLLTYIDPPAAYRLVYFELNAGKPQVLKKVRGELRGGVFDEPEGRFHALLTHGLYEVTFEPFAIRRQLRRGLAKYPYSATRVGDDALAVRVVDGKTCARVSLDDYAVTGRYRIPGVDAAFALDGEPRIFAFGHGLQSELDAGGRTVGTLFEAPLLLSPVVTPETVLGIAARRAKRKAGRPDPATPQGAVVRLDRSSLTTVARQPLPGVCRLLGVDGAGRLVATTRRELVLLDPESLTVLARKTVGHRLLRCALAGPSTVVTAATLRASRELSVLEWDEDLARPVRKTKGIKPAHVPRKVREADRIVHVREQYLHQRIGPKPPYEDRVKERVVIGGRGFRRCVFTSCTINRLFTGQRARYVVRDVHLDRCTLRGGSAANVAFEECLVERPKVSHQLLLTGCVFRHVTIRGAAGFLCMYDYSKHDISEEQRRARHAEIEAYYRGVDWALDVREADMENMRIENVPVELVRRDPHEALLVWTKDADHPVWQSDPLTSCLWRREVMDAAGEGRRGVLLTALKSPRYQKKYAAAERALRDAGLVDDVTGVG